MAVDDGTTKTKTLYPFLEKKNYYLDYIASQVVVNEAPHLAVHGQVKKAWLKAAVELRKQKSPETGKFLFPTITPENLKSRFDAWMAFVPIFRAKQERDSGPDDVVSGGDILEAIETVYDEKEAEEAVTSGKRAVDAKKTVNDKAGAEYLKCKAAGIPVPDEVIAILDNAGEDEEEDDSNENKKAPGTKVRLAAVPPLSSVRMILLSLETQQVLARRPNSSMRRTKRQRWKFVAWNLRSWRNVRRPSWRWSARRRKPIPSGRSP